MTKSDNERYHEWERMTTSNNEWQWMIQRVIKSDNKRKWVTVCDSSGTTNANSTVQFKEWVIAILSMTKQIQYYFKEWMAAIRVVK